MWPQDRDVKDNGFRVVELYLVNDVTQVIYQWVHSSILYLHLIIEADFVKNISRHLECILICC